MKKCEKNRNHKRFDIYNQKEIDESMRIYDEERGPEEFDTHKAN